MDRIKWNEQLQAEGGIGWVVDIMGGKLPLTRAEAEHYPFRVDFIPWKLIDGYWTAEPAKENSESPPEGA